jgi:hypothetical protein
MKVSRRRPAVPSISGGIARALALVGVYEDAPILLVSLQTADVHVRELLASLLGTIWVCQVVGHFLTLIWNKSDHAN